MWVVENFNPVKPYRWVHIIKFCYKVDYNCFFELFLVTCSLVPRPFPLPVLQYANMQGNAWEIWLRAVMSCWQRVGRHTLTGGRVPNCNNYFCITSNWPGMWTMNGIDSTLLTLWPPAVRLIVQERLWDSLLGTAPCVYRLPAWCHHTWSNFPGLPLHNCILQVIKDWRWEQPGNKARYHVCITVIL